MRVNFLRYTFLLFSIVLVTGCTANSWGNIASGVLQANDEYEKESRAKKIKAANKAAGY